MGQRIKGQEVEVMLVVGSSPIFTISAIRSFDFGFDTEIKKEGYLGETTQRGDSVFNGITGKLEYHLENRELLDLAVAITQIARRRTPGVVVNIKATLNFPDTRIARVIVPNVHFGAWPFSFGGRAEYGSVSIDYFASEATLI